MNALDGILQTLTEDPADQTTWLVLSDYLEEHDELPRAELLRLHLKLRPVRLKGRQPIENRVIEMLLAGVQPCGPSRMNSIGMQINLIPAGVFQMGSPRREARRMNDEMLHTVRITRPFWMGIHLVTQQQFKEVMGNNPSHFSAQHDRCKGLVVDQFPVDSVSWTEAVQFCRTLTRLERMHHLNLEYRLPTEAEWEYACRGRISSRYPFWFGPRITSTLANFDGTPFPVVRSATETDHLGRTSVVGSYPPNPWGLYDMHGNLDEWCLDWCDYTYYEYGPTDDPLGPAERDTKIIRGGSWRGQGEDCRAAVRIGETPDYTHMTVGFRVVLAKPIR